MKLLISCFLFFIIHYCFGQDYWVNYTNNHSINDIAETETGYFIGSDGGLCFYNPNLGNEIYYNRGNSDIPSNHILDLLLQSNEELWVTTDLGLCKMNNGEFTSGPKNLTGIMRESLDKKIIVANYDNLYIQVDGMDFQAIPYPGSVAQIEGLEVDQESGAIYINVINYFAESYIAEWKDDQWTILFSDFIYETSMTIDHQNQLWFSSSLGLQYYKDGIWNLILEMAGADSFLRSKLFVDKDDNIIIMKTFEDCSKLKIWNGSTLNDFDFVKDDCSDCRFIKPSEFESDLYFASNAYNGLYRFDSNGTEEYMPLTQSPLLYNNVQNTLHPSDGSHIIIFHDRIQVINSGNWSEISLPSDLSGPVKKGFLDPAENLWIFDDHFLWKYENDNWTKLVPPAEVDDILMLMDIGKNGDIWIQSKLNIARFRDNEWKIFKAIHHHITSSIIKAMKVDPQNGDLWVTTFQGVRHYDGQIWNSYDDGPINHTFDLALGNGGAFVRTNSALVFIQNGERDTIPLPSEGYYGSFESKLEYDAKAQKLYLTGSQILAVYHLNEWTTYSTEDSGYYNSLTNDVRLDQDDNVWFSGWRGGVCIFNENGIISLSVDEKEFNEPISLFKVYPTVVSQNYFYLESEIEGKYQVALSDVNGHVIYNRKHQLSKSVPIIIELSAEMTNLIFVTIRDENQAWTQRIIAINN